MEIVSYIKLSLSNFVLPLYAKKNGKKRKERKRKKGKTKKAEREKYKNNKKKTSIFSRTLESRFRLVTFLSFFYPRSYVFLFAFTSPNPPSFERCKPRCVRKTVYFIFNTPNLFFFLPPPRLSSFQIFQILFFSALLPLSIRVSKDDFTCCEFDRSFCSGERAEYFDEHEADFSRKIISTNWLGKILKRKKKKEGENSILLTRSLRRPRCVLGLIRFSISCNRLIRPSF